MLLFFPLSGGARPAPRGGELHSFLAPSLYALFCASEIAVLGSSGRYFDFALVLSLACACFSAMSFLAPLGVESSARRSSLQHSGTERVSFGNNSSRNKAPRKNFTSITVALCSPLTIRKPNCFWKRHHDVVHRYCEGWMAYLFSVRIRRTWSIVMHCN